eukprot:GFYU01002195.1.p1 GENE.GFYU01002195.1~~GFYU01002195.1.p1  ORF type:complete len:330 (-),score=84.63 GFYU01002195.1:100-1089(-)
MKVTRIVTLALSAALGAVGAAAGDSDLFRGGFDSSFGRTPSLITDDVTTNTIVASASNDGGGTVYYIANDSTDFNIYSLDLANPEGEPTLVAQSPSDPARLTVYGQKLYWCTGPIVYSCDLKDGVCDTSAAPAMVHAFDNNVVDMHVSKSGNFFVGEATTHNLYRGAVQGDGSITFTLYTTLDAMRAVTTTNNKVLTCCKVTSSRDSGSIVQMSESATAPVAAADQKVMWENQDTFELEATETGTVWWVSSMSQDPMRYAYAYQPGAYQQVMSPQWANYVVDVSASGPFWYGPLVATDNMIYHCSQPSCQQFTEFNTSVKAYRMFAVSS